MPKNKPRSDRLQKSALTHFFKLRMGLVILSLLSLLAIMIGLFVVAGQHEEEHNYIVDTLGRQRMYTQRLAQEANRVASLLEAIDSPDRVQPVEVLRGKLAAVRGDMIDTSRRFESTLSSIKTGRMPYKSTTIELFESSSEEFVPQIAQIETDWTRLKDAVSVITKTDVRSVEFRRALIYINENNDSLLRLSENLSAGVLGRFAQEYHESQIVLSLFIFSLVLLCVWILFGTWHYFIEPYAIFYKGIKTLGTEKDLAQTEPAKNASPLMSEVKNTFVVMRDMIRFIGVINEGSSFKDTLHSVFQAFRSHIPYNYIGIATFVGYAGTTLKASYGESDGSFPGLPARLADQCVEIGTTSLGSVLASGNPRIINDLESYSRTRPMQEYTRVIIDEGIRSSITLPLLVNGKAIGFLFFSSREKNVYTDLHVDFLRNIRNAIALSFEKNIFVDELVYSSTLALAKMAEAKDEDTAEHLDRMRQYSVLLAHCLRDAGAYRESITPEFLHALERFSPMHDIGKVGIRDNVLLKPGKLDDEEMAHMRTHAQYGANVLREAEDNIARSGRTLFGMGISIALGHHERWDGKGYPRRIAGYDIPVEARIVAVADVFDALTTRRPYKEPYSFDRSVAMVIEERGSHFDPQIIDVFAASVDRFRTLYESFRSQIPGVY